MVRMMRNVDLILEVRDSRIPLSCRNPLFDKAFSNKRRIIIYNKMDLSGGLDRRLPQKWDAPNNVLFTEITADADIKKVLRLVRSKAAEIDSKIGVKALVVGLPNVGKSSLLNALRHVGLHKGKTARTGAQPGVTRSIATSVKIIEEPLTYIIDTPGVMAPYVPDAETMLKLALVASVKESILDAVTISDYLLFKLNLYNPTCYSKYCEPTNEVMHLLEQVSWQTGKLAKGGAVDEQAASAFLLSRFRSGGFGAFCLDNVSENSFQQRLQDERLRDYGHLLNRQPRAP